jgi:alkylated DNA repair dioxygenase AlkB
MIKIIEGGLKDYEPTIKKWDKPTVREFNGKKVEGRPTKGYGTSSFEYAGKTYKPEPWTISMEIIKMATELLVYKELNRVVRFSFCLCGLYETGKMGIPHHSDTVPTLDDLVVGVSFGAPRILEWTEYGYDIKEATNTSKINVLSTGNAITRRYLLKDGDVYIFDGHSQMTSTHSIPTIENVDKRINLTFRTGL